MGGLPFREGGRQPDFSLEMSSRCEAYRLREVELFIWGVVGSASLLLCSGKRVSRRDRDLEALRLSKPTIERVLQLVHLVFRLLSPIEHLRLRLARPSRFGSFCRAAVVLQIRRRDSDSVTSTRSGGQAEAAGLARGTLRAACRRETAAEVGALWLPYERSEVDSGGSCRQTK